MRASSGKEEVSQSEAARRLGMTPQALGVWARRDGAPVTLRKGKPFCLWPDFPRWRDRELDRQARAEASPADLEEAKRRKLAAEAEIAEHELAQIRGDMIHKDDVAKIIASILDPIRATMLTIPAKWAPSIVGCMNVGEAQQALEPLATAALQAWSGDA